LQDAFIYASDFAGSVLPIFTPTGLIQQLSQSGDRSL
jgi:hypothetical protein